MTKVQTPNNIKHYYYNIISYKIFSYEWMLPTINLPTSCMDSAYTGEGLLKGFHWLVQTMKHGHTC